MSDEKVQYSFHKENRLDQKEFQMRWPQSSIAAGNLCFGQSGEKGASSSLEDSGFPSKDSREVDESGDINGYSGLSGGSHNVVVDAAVLQRSSRFKKADSPQLKRFDKLIGSAQIHKQNILNKKETLLLAEKAAESIVLTARNSPDFVEYRQRQNQVNQDSMKTQDGEENESKPSSTNSKQATNKTRLLPYDQMDITPADVLLGRGKRATLWKGNLNYKKLICAYVPAYESAKKNKDKTDITVRIVEHIRSLGGRFLKENSSTGKLADVSDATARLKVGQALRHRMRQEEAVDEVSAEMDTAETEDDEDNDHDRTVFVDSGNNPTDCRWDKQNEHTNDPTMPPARITKHDGGEDRHVAPTQAAGNLHVLLEAMKQGHGGKKACEVMQPAPPFPRSHCLQPPLAETKDKEHGVDQSFIKTSGIDQLSSHAMLQAAVQQQVLQSDAAVSQSLGCSVLGGGPHAEVVGHAQIHNPSRAAVMQEILFLRQIVKNNLSEEEKRKNSGGNLSLRQDILQRREKLALQEAALERDHALHAYHLALYHAANNNSVTNTSSHFGELLEYRRAKEAAARKHDSTMRSYLSSAGGNLSTEQLLGERGRAVESSKYFQPPAVLHDTHGSRADFLTSLQHSMQNEKAAKIRDQYRQMEEFKLLEIAAMQQENVTAALQRLAQAKPSISTQTHLPLSNDELIQRAWEHPSERLQGLRALPTPTSLLNEDQSASWNEGRKRRIGEYGGLDRSAKRVVQIDTEGPMASHVLSRILSRH